ncbi:MAG TPA: carbohydrate binding domain-containing protein, partial [Candidatus Nitrosopolaris sp.]|nr:carbohydrate binding domain-containing protein [Candidatus Nitrosopolaris sp.]
MGSFVFVVLLTTVIISSLGPKTQAITASTYLNFQARLYTAAGAIVPDGNYNLEFKIYNADSTTGSQGSCSGACLWMATLTGGNVVKVVNGYFSVSLGAVNTVGSFSTINWDQQLYLTMRVGGTGTPSWDPEMQNSGHSIVLTAVPLAFRANQLAVAGTNEQVLQFASSTFGQTTTISLPDPGATTANICYSTTGGAVNGTCAPASGGSGYVQLQGSTPGTAQTGNFNISGGGAGTGIATTFYATNFDVATSNTAMNIGTTNAALITLGNTTNSSFTFKAKSSSTAYQFQNSSGSALLNIDTSNINNTNLVSNSSFEAALANWNALNGGAASQSATAPYEGADVLKIVDGTGAGGGGATYTGAAPPLLANGSIYTLSAYVRTDFVGAFTTFEMGHADNGTAPTLVPCLTAQTLTTGWARFSCSWTSGAITGNPFIYFKQTDTAVSRNIYVDDVLLQTDANSQPLYRNAGVSLAGTIITSPVVLQGSNNETSALQVNNSIGTQIFDIDTTDSNLVLNPGFEVNQANWALKGSATALTRDTSTSYAGIASGKVTTTATAGDGLRYTFPTQLPASTYTISAYVKVSAADSTFNLGYNNGADVNCASITPAASASVPSTSGWTRFVCTTATSAVLNSVYITSGTTALTSLWADSVQVEAGSTATAYGAGNINLNAVIQSPLFVRNLNNSTTALTLQDSSSNTLLNVDTLNDIINLGSTGTQALASTVNIANSSGNAAQTVNVGSNANAGSAVVIDAGTTAGKLDIGNSTTAHVIRIGAGGTSAQSVTAGSTSSTSTATIQAGVSGGAETLQLQVASGGVIGIGTTASTSRTIDVGSTSAVIGASTVLIASTSDATTNQVVTIGSNAANTSDVTTVQGGSGTIAGTGAAIKLQPNTAGDILIGNTAGTGIITVGSSSAGQTVNIANGAGAPAVNIGNISTSGVTVSIAGANANTTLNSISIANGNTGSGGATVSILSGTGTAGTGTLNLGNNTRVTTIGLGNIAPFAARTISIGSTGAQTPGVVDTINIGTAAGTVAGAETINIGSGTPTGSGTNLVTIGSIASGIANQTTIQGGNGATAVSIQAASGGTILLGSSANNPVQIGTGAVAGTIQIGGTGTTGTITLGQSSATSGTVTINIGSNIGAGGTQAINIGNSSTGTGNITIGNTAAGNTILQGATSIQVASLTAVTANSQVLCRDTSTHNLTSCDSGAGGKPFIQGGNSFGATAVLGTNDSNSLTFETNNATQATIAVGGATTFKNSANSNVAFQVQNASGSQLFNVDTTTTNLVTNPSFEQNTTNWAAKVGTETLAQTASQQYIGNDALSVTTAATIASGAKFSGYTLLANTTYTLSAYVKLASGGLSSNIVYSTGTICQGSSSCTVASNTITGVGTTFTSGMVGGLLTVTSGASAGTTETVTGFTSATSITVSSSLTFAAGASYSITYNIISVGREDNGSDLNCTNINIPAITSTAWTDLSCTFTTGGTIGTNFIYIAQNDATARTFY